MAKAKKDKPALTRIEQFARSFRDEAELRIALIALLELMPGTKNVRHSHGSNERGKDIIFNFPVAFGRDELIACVVKNDPITGSAESDKGTRTVGFQAEQCFDTPITNHLGISENVARVYVITPYECDHHAIDSIRGKLNKPDNAAKFIFGRELYDLFEAYYPDYLLFRSGLFGSYVTDLEKGLSSDSAILNVLVRHGIAGNNEVTKIYVQPSFSMPFKQFKLLIRRVIPSRVRTELSEVDVLVLTSPYGTWAEF